MMNLHPVKNKNRRLKPLKQEKPRQDVSKFGLVSGGIAAALAALAVHGAKVNPIAYAGYPP